MLRKSGSPLHLAIWLSMENRASYGECAASVKWRTLLQAVLTSLPALSR